VKLGVKSLYVNLLIIMISWRPVQRWSYFSYGHDWNCICSCTM